VVHDVKESTRWSGDIHEPRGRKWLVFIDKLRGKIRKVIRNWVCPSISSYNCCVTNQIDLALTLQCMFITSLIRTSRFVIVTRSDISKLVLQFSWRTTKPLYYYLHICSLAEQQQPKLNFIALQSNSCAQLIWSCILFSLGCSLYHVQLQISVESELVLRTQVLSESGSYMLCSFRSSTCLYHLSCFSVLKTLSTSLPSAFISTNESRFGHRSISSFRKLGNWISYSGRACHTGQA
jgi:hypothetical protein